VAELKHSPWTIKDYERAAREYLASLPLEHFMEGIPQATQRKITSESFDVLQTFCPDVQLFNELQIQYFFKGKHRSIVPDQFARKCAQAPLSRGTFILQLEPAAPLVVMEYISPRSKRKDYKDNFRKYERELKVPYCLLFDPMKQDLKLYRHDGQKYQLVTANAQGRLPLPELELEIALLDGWVRFWYRGQLLPLPDQLQRQLVREKQRADRAERRAEQEKQRAEQEKQRAEQEKQRAEQEKQRAERESQLRAEAETDSARLRALLAQLQGQESDSGRAGKKIPPQ
jgi:Uma2 family endonuclease